MLLFLPLLLFWDDHRYYLTPCLHLVPNHQQNTTTNTDHVDNLKALIQQPKHNDQTSFLNHIYQQ